MSLELKIFISSAVILKEKEIVKDALETVLKHYEIRHEIYDCNEHSTSWDLVRKQEIINRKIIHDIDWFICLIPHNQVGKATWEELKTILQEKKEGSPVVISVFHPYEQPEKEKIAAVPEGKISFDTIKHEAGLILGSEDDQYEVDYRYDDMESLREQIGQEFEKAYFRDQSFRTQHLVGLCQLGRTIKSSAIYFDKNRANIDNGFIDNKYYPRRKVDGALQDAIEWQKKIIILLGAPGAGKTRAMYQLLADPSHLIKASDGIYGLGSLADKQVIVLDRDNISYVNDFLKEEVNYIRYHQPLGEYYLVCDQIKDVLSMLSYEEMFGFMDKIVKYSHIRLIATSIPSAFENLKEVWRNHGYRHFEDEDITKCIEIPLISADPEVVDLRNWIQKELYSASQIGETIGDFIPKLNQYKQSIINSLYRKSGESRYLRSLLTAIQITETFRYETALFLPILIAHKCSNGQDAPFTRDDKQEIVNTLNFLLAKNLIWIRSSRRGLVANMQTRDLELNEFMDSRSDFVFEDEYFGETPISTTFSYGLNEVVWDELEKTDRSIRLDGRQEPLLLNMQDHYDIEKAAKCFYHSFPMLSSLRRILPRIPRTDGYETATTNLWTYVYKQYCQQSVIPENAKELELGINILISHARNKDEVMKAVEMLKQKGISPNHSTIGSLYTAVRRLDSQVRDELYRLISEIREKNRIYHHSFYSFSAEVQAKHLSFNDIMDNIKNTGFVVSTDEGEKMVMLNKVGTLSLKKIETFGLRRLIDIVAMKARTWEEWEMVLHIFENVGIKISNRVSRQYFLSLADAEIKSNNLSQDEPKDLMVNRLQSLIQNHSDILETELHERYYFDAVSAAWNFKQAMPVYNLYVEKMGQDNSKLLSIALNSVRDNEFRVALNFVNDVAARMNAAGNCIDSICYNHLIKEAPHSFDALAVLPYIKYVSEYTLTNILYVIKRKHRIDERIFFYAYSALMQPRLKEYLSSVYVLGLLYDISQTKKQEKFIQELVQKTQGIEKKRKLIDYSTGVASTRIGKNYRTLDEVWEIFNKCRTYYWDNRLFVKSDLYSQLMNKIIYLCQDDPITLRQQQDRVRRIIEEDFPRIIRDENFYSNMYRFFPEKHIFNDDCTINEDFIKDMYASNITEIRVWNRLMLWFVHEKMSFRHMITFYNFVLDYYLQQARWKALRPDENTVTHIMETVQTEEQFHMAEDIARQWITCPFDIVRGHYAQACAEARARIGLATADVFHEKTRQHNNTRFLPKEATYEERVDHIINLAIRDIYYYGSLTYTLFNKYLKGISTVREDIKGNRNLPEETIRACIVQTYWNLKNNLIDKYREQIGFNNLSYVFLVNLSTDVQQAGNWIEEFLRLGKDTYQYDIITCASMATSVNLAYYDIDICLDFFEYWEDAMMDVGYDPSDTDSIPPHAPQNFRKTVQKEKHELCGLGYDYDSYWETRSRHALCQMFYYVRTLRSKKDPFCDKQTLQFIKDEIHLFKEYGIPFPECRVHGELIDFNQEFAKLKNIKA